jgi:two-component system, OmpR family, phosphate regulon sensor histidine kinase PhoR
MRPINYKGHIEDLLKSTIPAGYIPDCEEVDVNEVINEVLASFKLRFLEANAHVEFISGTETANICIDRGPLSLIVSNLIDNALKYVNKNPQITITTENKGNKLIVKLKDNGIGIKKEDLSHIFDKFFRVSTGDIHNIKGFGLGLTYVKKVTEQFNGSIAAESTLDKGSTFILTFPLIATNDKNIKNSGN